MDHTVVSANYTFPSLSRWHHP